MERQGGDIQQLSLSISSQVPTTEHLRERLPTPHCLTTCSPAATSTQLSARGGQTRDGVAGGRHTAALAGDGVIPGVVLVAEALGTGVAVADGDAAAGLDVQGLAFGLVPDAVGGAD